MKMLSIKLLKLAKTIKTIKIRLKSRFSLINNNFREKSLIARRKIELIIIVTIVINVRLVLISSFFLSDLGKYLINPVPNPRALNEVIRDMTEIRVVARPTCSVVNNLAFIIQKTNPKKAMTKVFIIK